MNIKYWLILRDDGKRTFEVCGKEANENSFTNRTYAMQRAGMNVSCMTPPVTGMTASKDQIKITGYTLEPGLQERLQREHLRLVIKDAHDDDM